MTDQREEMHCKIVGLLLFLICIVLLAMVASGCQTFGGMCRDLESVGRYGHEHTICEK